MAKTIESVTIPGLSKARLKRLNHVLPQDIERKHPGLAAKREVQRLASSESQASME